MPKYTLIYIGIISLLSVIITIYDKIAAKINQRHRTRERTLFLFSALGGSVAMYLTMLIIHHKTLHNKFMIGIPIIIVIQLVTIFLLWRYDIELP